ncbi:DNA topoisomerase I, putative [Eimeria brunetti]|uniref:DNA topoisomerase I, putative n=1 Tax=Eimeria brunetti TaxID=51314 RepID=U6LFU6_9EIME|nr:DNA topoisomerase I, putative [Eimeria brunetti]
MQKKRELDEGSSDEDSVPLSKRFKKVKEEPPAAAAAAAPAAAAAAEDIKTVKEAAEETNSSSSSSGSSSGSSSTTATSNGSGSNNGDAAAAAAPAAAAAAAGAAAAAKPASVSGSLAAALRNVKAEAAHDASPAAAAAATATAAAGSPAAAAALKKELNRPSASPSPGLPRRRNKYTKTEENFEPISRWWEKDLSQLENNLVQWQYLEHNGLIFAPPYEPHGVCIDYKGQTVSLPPEAEEVANFWCGVLESDYASKIRFVRNFWRAFLSKLPSDHLIKQDPKHTQVRIPDPDSPAAAAAAAAAAEGKPPPLAEDAAGFEACDFSRIKKHLDALKEAKKNLSREEKERRIFSEDVILNLSEDSPVPVAAGLPGHCWKDVAHDARVTWLAFYRDSINDQTKRRTPWVAAVYALSIFLLM